MVWVNRMGLLYGLTSYWHGARQEFNDAGTKNIIAIARHHVPRIGDIDVLTVCAQLKETLSALFTEHIRQPSTYQQSWQR